MKKIYIESLGCAKNQVDSEILLTYAKENGYESVEDAANADIIVVNTCGFIESAKEEAIETFFSLNEYNKDAKIVLAGCLAERYLDDLELEEADAIFGNKDLSKFPELLKSLEESEDQVKLKPDYPDPDSMRDDRLYNLSTKNSAYLKISEGCNHRCNYCAIPIIRGGLKSRPKEALIKEAKRLVSQGVYEINLIAQDLGAYGTDIYGKSEFVSLVEEMAKLEGTFVLRMLYIHPDTFPLDLIDVVANNEKILPYFDIPFQHADKKVLTAMKRTGDRETYVALIKKIRKSLPNAVIRSTIMLGHPEETDEAQKELIRFIKEAELDWVGSFLYSREEDTPSFEMRGEKEHDKAHKKAIKYQKELNEVQEEITFQRLENFVGSTYTALVEIVDKEGEFALARIYSQAPDVDGITEIITTDLEVGDVVKVGIKGTRDFDLDGVLVYGK